MVISYSLLLGSEWKKMFRDGSVIPRYMYIYLIIVYKLQLLCCSIQPAL
jgi:hypothetical protein